MRFTSILAIFLLFWVMSAMILLPFGVRTPDETGEKMVPGQAHSAPSNFRPGRHAVKATILALVLFGLYYANYVNGWVSVDDIDISKYMTKP
jgi:predicted secreted protein